MSTVPSFTPTTPLSPSEATAAVRAGAEAAKATATQAPPPGTGDGAAAHEEYQRHHAARNRALGAKP